MLVVGDVAGAMRVRPVSASRAYYAAVGVLALLAADFKRSVCSVQPPASLRARALRGGPPGFGGGPSQNPEMGWMGWTEKPIQAVAVFYCLKTASNPCLGRVGLALDKIGWGGQKHARVCSSVHPSTERIGEA